MSTARDVLRRAHAAGVMLVADGPVLKLRAEAKPPHDLLEMLRAHKAELLTLLSQGDAAQEPEQSSADNGADKATGETRHGLNVAAWKVERVASIGKNRERKPGAYQSDGEGQHRQSGRCHPEFNDDLSF